MHEKINTQELLSNTLPSEVISRYVTLKPSGIHQRGLCPFHDDKTSSLTVTDSKKLYKCFACGAGGDVIDFLVRMGRTFPEACAEIQTGQMIPSTDVNLSTVAKPAVVWQIIDPVPDNAPEPTFHHYRFIGIKPTSVYMYAQDGKIRGFVVRFDAPGQKKETLPYTLRTDGTRIEWRWEGWPVKPIYNIDALKLKPHANVLIVEGEKACDAAAKLFPALAVITWQGGTDSIHKVDFSPLHGRKIILWPDNDEPGFLAMYGGWKIQQPIKGVQKPPVEYNGIADILRPRAALKTFRLPEKIAKKWDAADAKWTPEQAQEYVSKNLIDIPEHGPMPVPAPPPPDNPPPPADAPVHEALPFRFLGFVKDHRAPIHCFFSEQSKTVVQIPVTGMSAMNLLNLAPLKFWQGKFPTKASPGFHVPGASDWLLSNSLRHGIFNPVKIRGRGAWMDEGRVVLHTGAELIVDGITKKFQEHKTRYIYEQSVDLFVSLENPLSNADSVELIKLAEKINWERPINAYLLAGWCVIAPVCGALKWRPHIWITGSKGTGKTWVHHSIVKPILGDMVLSVENGTTEPAIRQSLMTDSLPIFMDEAEGENKTAYERMQNIIQLARSSSTENDSSVIKGGHGGSGPVSFKIRSCFAFSSITPQLRDTNDRSRFSILTILEDKSETRKKKFEDLKKHKDRLLTPEYAQRLQARTIKLLPTIIKNIRTFTDAAIEVIGDQRVGDQLGALLAGAYSLGRNSEISLTEAIKWIKQRDWSQEHAVNKEAQESACWHKLMEHIMYVESAHGSVQRSVGELIIITEGNVTGDLAVNPNDARAALIRKGFKIKVHPDGQTFIHVATRHSLISNILSGTNWVDNYGEILSRMEGAHRSPGSERFNGINCRTINIPLWHVIDKAEQGRTEPVTAVAHVSGGQDGGLAEQIGLFQENDGYLTERF